MKRVLLVISILLSFSMFCACSSDDEMGDVTKEPLTSESNDEKNGEIPQGTNDERVDFQLQDKDGKECYSFKEGDNIIFRIEIKNDTGEDAIMPRFYEIIGFNAFRVYSINGEDKGTPWDEIFTNFLRFDFIGAHSSAVILCPWFDIPTLADEGHEHFYSGFFYKKEEKSPLPKGEYYSRFDAKLDDKTITCNRNFIIE